MKNLDLNANTYLLDVAGFDGEETYGSQGEPKKGSTIRFPKPPFEENLKDWFKRHVRVVKFVPPRDFNKPTPQNEAKQK